MPAVGIDISDASMRFVELVEKRKGFVLGSFGERAIPRGVVESGEIKKPADLRALLAEIKKVYNLEFVSVALPEEKAYLFELRIPITKYSALRGVIELSIEEHVPMAADEVIFDYDIISESETFIDVSVSAVARTLVDGYLEAFEGSGIKPISFEVEAHSLMRAIIPDGDKGTSMIVDFGKIRTGVAIISGGTVQFTSTVLVGGGMLTDIIAKNQNIPYDAAEKIKKEKGVLGGDLNKDMSTALMSTLLVLRNEITKHQIYWQMHSDDYGKKRPEIQKIYLCGGDSNLAGFLEFLAAGISAPVELANAMVNVNTLDEYIPEISFNDSLRYATAIGLALRRPL